MYHCPSDNPLKKSLGIYFYISLCVCYTGSGNAGAIIGGIVVALLVAIIVVAVILVVLWIKRFLNYPLTTSLLHQFVCCYRCY